MAEGDAPKLYNELAAWWPLLSAPHDYAEEAAGYQRILLEASGIPTHTLLELGSGGGNNASHLKARFSLVLVDRSPGMLRVSRALNPECEHVEGDMRTVRLGREFDAVFVHDAVVYMTTEADLRRAIETAYVHCKPGGAALFAPDHVRENFRPSTDHGGHDDGTRGLRYLEWTWDPDPGRQLVYGRLRVFAARRRWHDARGTGSAHRGLVRARGLAAADGGRRVSAEGRAVRALRAGTRRVRSVRGEKARRSGGREIR